MFSIDSIQVAILWCIAGVGVICALNARGFFRQLISWLIVITIIVVSALFSYIKIVSVKQEILGEKSNSQQTIFNPLQNIFVGDSNLQVSSSSEAANNAEDSASINYISMEKQILENMLSISDSVLSFPKWEYITSQGIEKRENFESKARSLKNKSMSPYWQIKNLSPPSNKKQSYNLMLSAAENLRLAAYEVHRQFGSETDTLGNSIEKACEYANQAKLTINTIMGKE